MAEQARGGGPSEEVLWLPLSLLKRRCRFLSTRQIFSLSPSRSVMFVSRPGPGPQQSHTESVSTTQASTRSPAQLRSYSQLSRPFIQLHTSVYVLIEPFRERWTEELFMLWMEADSGGKPRITSCFSMLTCLPWLNHEAMTSLLLWCSERWTLSTTAAFQIVVVKRFEGSHIVEER